MLFLKIIALSLGSLIILFILTKITGNREMSQLTMFDYITSITIGSIAAEMSTSLENNFLEPVVAMLTYGTASTLIAYMTCKSLKFRRFMSSRTLLLYDNGEFFRKNFLKAKIDINEFLMQARINGFFNMSDIQTAYLESNGKISFLPKSNKRPTTPEDFNLSTNTENTVANLIIDGKLLTENLKWTGNSEAWLNNELNKLNIKNISDVFLATYDNNKKLNVYVKVESENSNDFFC